MLFCLEVFALEKNCPEGQYLVKGHHRRGYVRSDGMYVRATNVVAHCKSLTKAAEYLQNLFKNGVPSDWPHKMEKPVRWTEEEKERLVEALEELPEVLFSKKLKGVYRLQKSKDHPNPATSADGIIVLYDTSFDSPFGLGRILAHELLHQSFKDMPKKDQQDYHLATGWHLKLMPNRMIYWNGRQTGYVQDDGKNSFEEDYANNLEYYLYDSDKLKKVTPSAYQWIKRRFGQNFQLKRRKK